MLVDLVLLYIIVLFLVVCYELLVIVKISFIVCLRLVVSVEDEVLFLMKLICIWKYNYMCCFYYLNMCMLVDSKNEFLSWDFYKF